MKPMTLRLLPVGMDFYLLRTGQRFKLVSAGPSPAGGIKYTVQKEGEKYLSTLHHSCQIKPVVRAQDRGARALALAGDKIARQGHRYSYRGNDAIALQTGARVKILVSTGSSPWDKHTTFASASELIPQSMAYFGGQVPQ